MSNKETRDASVGFEVVESDEYSAVYKRVVPAKHRSLSTLHNIEMSLPKATLHSFTEEDYIELKKLEEKIRQEMLENLPTYSPFVTFVSRLLK